MSRRCTRNYLANPAAFRQLARLLRRPAARSRRRRQQCQGRAAPAVVNAFAERAKQGGHRVVVASGADSEMGRKRTAVQQLIAAYRNVGARWADLDPLKRAERADIPDLEPSFYGFTDADQETVFNTSNTYFGKETMPLRELLNALRETYCGTIGAEFMYNTDQSEKRWWQQKLESIRSKPNFTAEKKRHILDRLTAAEGLERFLHTKYVGQKRFSLEGGESFIASMDELIQQGGVKGLQEIVIGMAHRGRLNVLVNSLGKVPADLFAEFDHTRRKTCPAGDVKYHQGFSSDVTTPGGPVHLTLAFNPSHLEIVNPVVEGSVRARMDRRADPQGKQVLPVLVHGDAAFAGQGVVHGDAGAGRDARLLHRRHGAHRHQQPDRLHHQRPARQPLDAVLHRRGQDDRGAGAARERATTRRRWCWPRSWRWNTGWSSARTSSSTSSASASSGHNEQDTPALTQPLMYKKIAQHPGTRKLYATSWLRRAWARRLGRHGQGYGAALDRARTP
jgi:2-oxoglutarate dehydrogenase E1 component